MTDFENYLNQALAECQAGTLGKVQSKLTPHFQNLRVLPAENTAEKAEFLVDWIEGLKKILAKEGIQVR